MRDLMTLNQGGSEQITSLWHMCSDEKVHPEAKLDWPYLKSILSNENSRQDLLVFAILRLRIATGLQIQNDVSAPELCDVLVKHVLRNALSRRLVLQAALCLVDKIYDFLVLSLTGGQRESLLDSVADLAEVSVFKEVRKIASLILAKFGDGRAEIMVLLCVPSGQKLAKNELKGRLLDKYPALRPTEEEESGVVGVLNRDYDGKFLNYLRACRALKSEKWIRSPGSNEYPGIVALYYLLLQVEDVPGEVIAELLASRRFVERRMALVHVGVSLRVAFRSQVIHKAVHDPIKDVRGCAAKVAELLPHVASEQGIKKAHKMLELQTELLEKERANLVLDFEFITKVQEESEVREWLHDLLKPPKQNLSAS